MKTGRYILALMLCLHAVVSAAAVQRTESPDGISQKLSTRESLELIPQASIVMPWTMTLHNAFGEIPYADSAAGGVPTFFMGVAKPVTTAGQFQFLWHGKLGYGSKEGIFHVHPTDNPSATTQERITLRWLPVSAGTRIVYQIPSAQFVSPTLDAGGGFFWIMQRAQTEGLNQNFLVPYVFVTPAVTLLGGKSDNDWFGGATFGISLFRSVATSQTIGGHSFDLSFTIFL